jgi:hypothetical protein
MSVARRRIVGGCLFANFKLVEWRGNPRVVYLRFAPKGGNSTFLSSMLPRRCGIGRCKMAGPGTMEISRLTKVQVN